MLGANGTGRAGQRARPGRRRPCAILVWTCTRRQLSGACSTRAGRWSSEANRPPWHLRLLPWLVGWAKSTSCSSISLPTATNAAAPSSPATWPLENRSKSSVVKTHHGTAGPPRPPRPRAGHQGQLVPNQQQKEESAALASASRVARPRRHQLVATSGPIADPRGHEINAQGGSVSSIFVPPKALFLAPISWRQPSSASRVDARS